MKATQLMEELEWAIERNGGADVEVRMAQQPRWAFEYSIADAVVVENKDGEEVRDSVVGEKEVIVYLSEGSQIGYLPQNASDELGW